MSLFFVDCEGWGGCPATGGLADIGVVSEKTLNTFRGLIVDYIPDPANPAVPVPTSKRYDRHKVAEDLEAFVRRESGRDRPIMVSDNPAYDFMWTADLLWTELGRNIFGHSARRISDFYAGLVGDWSNTQKWKHLRVTPHDHNPVNDAIGNVEAFRRIMKGER